MSVNVEAMRQLRRVVLDAPDDRFEMDWFGKRTDCGTVCCAAGWAAIDPWFLVNTEIAKALPINENKWSEQVFDVDFGETSPIRRLADVFGLSYEDACALFNGDTAAGVTKADVVENIDRILDGEPAEPYEDDGDEEDDW